MDRPNSIPWPPLIFIAAAVVAVFLQRVQPVPWVEGAWRIALAAVGLCLVCGAVALEIVTAVTFRRHRTTILPHRAATNLITEGPFAKSRNPIYTGNTMLLLGAGLLVGSVWLIVAAPLAAYAVQKLAIEREERHLEARFGAQWRDYAQKTPRWLFWRG